MVFTTAGVQKQQVVGKEISHSEQLKRAKRFHKNSSDTSNPNNASRDVKRLLNERVIKYKNDKPIELTKAQLLFQGNCKVNI